MKPIRIAIPTLNSGMTIGATLEALRPLRDIAEIVVVDSGSTDATQAIVLAFGCELRHEPPGNMYAAINTGLSDAATPWVTYINSDDLLYPAATRSRLSQSRPDCDILYGTVDFIDQDGRFLRSWRPARPASLDTLYRAGYSPMLQQGTFIRRSLFMDLGGFSTKYSFVSDADFWIKALRAGASFYRQPACVPVAAFRLHALQATQLHATAMRNEHERMCRDHGTGTSKASATWALCKWRLENLGSYAERWLRAQRLGIRPRLCRSYTLPPDL